MLPFIKMVSRPSLGGATLPTQLAGLFQLLFTPPPFQVAACAVARIMKQVETKIPRNAAEQLARIFSSDEPPVTQGLARRPPRSPAPARARFALRRGGYTFGHADM